MNMCLEMFHNLHAKYILKDNCLILQLLCQVKVLIVCTDMPKSSLKSSANIDFVCKFISQKSGVNTKNKHLLKREMNENLRSPMKFSIHKSKEVNNCVQC